MVTAAQSGDTRGLQRRSADAWFRLVLESHYYQPAIALWRSLELALWHDQELEEPLLDLGCGNGYVASLILAPGAEAIGLDRVRSELWAACRLPIYRGVVQGDGCELPFPGDCFATVMSNCVVEHIPPLEAVLVEGARVLSPGGSFAFTTVSHRFPDLLGPVRALRDVGRASEATAYIEATNARLGHHHYYAPDVWEARLRQVGLVLRQATYFAPAPFLAAWEQLDVRLTRRLWRGRRPIDLFRRLVARRLVPRRLFVWLWYHRYRHLVSLPLLPGEEGGGLFLVAEKA